MKVLEAIQRTLRGETVEGFPMTLPPPVANPMGTLHAGILCDVADEAMGMACASLLDEGESFTTLELKINFLRPVLDASLEARARVVHSGKSMVYLECEIVALPEEKLVAKASSTCTILRGEQAKGRGGTAP